MTRHITLSNTLCYLGLAVLLTASVVLVVIEPSGRPWMMLPMALGGAMAAGSRLWRHRLNRIARGGQGLVDLGGYPMQILRDPRFL